MAGLIETYLAPSRESDLGHGTPAGLLDLRQLHALLRERAHLGNQVIAHEVQLRRRRLGGVNRRFRWRQTEDQPPASRVDVIEAEHVGEKGAIGIGVAAEQHDVRPKDHPHILPDRQPPRRRTSDAGRACGRRFAWNRYSNPQSQMTSVITSTPTTMAMPIRYHPKIDSGCVRNRATSQRTAMTAVTNATMVPSNGVRQP